MKGLTCVRCRSYLFEEDDVVFCPDCGAPHHRECYNALGHCALEELHGTAEEYSLTKVTEEEPPKAKESIKIDISKCEMCGAEYDPSLSRCPKCGAHDLNKINGFAQFDFLGGVPADYDLGEGVTAEEAKKFVVSNTHRYIPKFAVLNKENKVSWNWMAFLFPAGWMLSRKMYKGGIIAGIFTILASILSYPLSLSMYNLGTTANIESFAYALPDFGAAVVILALIGGLADIAVRIVSALLGDYMYKNYAITTIKEINATSDDKVADFRKKGGMSMWMFLLGLMLVQYGTAIITLFIK